MPCPPLHPNPALIQIGSSGEGTGYFSVLPFEKLPVPVFAVRLTGLQEGPSLSSELKVRVLAGEPLVHYGPFVMNCIDEINQAVEDFNTGKFGELAD